MKSTIAKSPFGAIRFARYSTSTTKPKTMARNYDVSTITPRQSTLKLKAKREQAAISALNSLQSNSAAVAAVRRSGGAMNKLSMPEMLDWCRRLGYEVCGPQ